MIRRCTLRYMNPAITSAWTNNAEVSFTLLSDFIPEMRQQRMFSDMDAWGYSFRLGSAKAWFDQDAEDASAWLLNHNLVTSDNSPTWNIRR